MKKLWSSSIQSTFSNAVSAGAAQIKQSWNVPSNTAAGASKDASTSSPSMSAKQPPSAPAAPSAPSAPIANDKQYLRLPIESARKLRWYDKSDLQALVKIHSREKSELNDTIAALKKLLIRLGHTELDIDLETKHLLSTAQQIEESDEGVSSTLLVAAQAELDALQETVQSLKQENANLSNRLRDLEGDDPKAFHFSLGTESLSGPATAAYPALEQLVGGLGSAMDQFEASLAASLSLSKQTRAVEAHISMAEASQAMQQLLQQQRQQQPAGDAAASGSGNDGATAGIDLQQSHMSLVAKLQRLEMERHMQVDEVTELSAQLQQAADEAVALQGQLQQAEERNCALAGSVTALQAELAAARATARAGEELAEKRAAELKRSQGSSQSAEVLARYQDLCVEAEQRAEAAERRLGLADARCAKLESLLKAAQAETKNAQKIAAVAVAEQESLAAKLVAAEAAAAAMAARLEHDDKQSEGALKLLEQVKQQEEELHALQGELLAARTAASAAEGRMQAAEGQEARLMAELREMEAAASKHEELRAQVVALREKLAEQRSERGQLEHYKQIALELEASRGRVEEELLVTAQLVTQLEARLRAAQARLDDADTAVRVAEGRARQAEASIATEVELRMAAACSNRALWPGPIKEEVGRLEQRLAALQASLVSLQSQLESDGAMLQKEVQAKVDSQRRAAELEDQLEQARQEAKVQLHRLQELLNDAQREAAVGRDTIHHLKLELAELSSQRQGGSSSSLNGGGPLARASSLIRRTSSSASMDSANSNVNKWQVQNRVGGGSLYGVADTVAAAATAASGGGGSSSSNHGDAAPAVGAGAAGPNVVCRDKLEGIDVIYLKNVVLKFLEAAVTGRVAERDALLPAVATLLQATPVEFKLLKKLFVNTTPPRVQVLSAFGIKL